MQIEEEWKSLYGFDQYEISSLGKIRSVPRITVSKDGKVNRRKGKVLSVRRTKLEPYLFSTVCFSKDVYGNGGARTVYIHKALAEHFVPKPWIHDPTIADFNYQYVTIIDGDCSNLSLDNLKWITHHELIGSQKRRLANPLKAWETRREKYGASGSPQKEIAEKIPRKKKEVKIQEEKPVYYGADKRSRLLRKYYEDMFGEIPIGWCVYHVDKNKDNDDPDNLIAVPRGILILLSKNLIDSTYFGIVKAVDIYLKMHTHLYR